MLRGLASSFQKLLGEPFAVAEMRGAIQAVPGRASA